MQKNRLVFTKINRAIYISHLDLMRSMQRAMKRSGLPIKYTEGFNPHIYLMFPLPLPLGVSGRCEIMDTDFTENVSNEEIMEKMNSVLPEDIRIISVSEQLQKHTEISRGCYKVTLFSDSRDALNEISDNLNKFFTSEKIEIEKTCKSHGRKVLKTIDLLPDIHSFEVIKFENAVECNVVLTAGVQNTVNPVTLFDKFMGEFNYQDIDISIERTKILSADGKDFA